MLFLEDIISTFRDSIELDVISKKFPLLSDDETPIWIGSPSFSSYLPRYFLAISVFLIHFCFYRVAVTVYAEGQAGYLNALIRIIGQLFDWIDVFAFIIVMLIFARINFYLNITTSNIRTTLFLIVIGLIPSLWFIINIVDWLLLIIGKESLNIPEWFDTWFLALGIINSSILILFSMISQFSYTYLITDQNFHFRKSHLIFYNSYTCMSFEEFDNLKTQQSLMGKLIGFGNILPIVDSNKSIDSNGDNNVKSTVEKFSYLFKLLLFYQRSGKEIMMSPSECLFGIKQPMLIYELTNELIDIRNGRPDLMVQNE